MEVMERLIALLKSPSKEMLNAGMTAAENCKDSGYDSGGDSYHSYEYYTSDAPAEIFRAMIAVALRQSEGTGA